MAVLKCRRGEVRWVNFDPSVGSEVQKRRPAIIVSNNSANKHLSRVQVVPLTSNCKHIYPSECVILIKGQKGKAMTDQIKTVSVKRVGNRIAVLTEFDMVAVDAVMKIQLGL